MILSPLLLVEDMEPDVFFMQRAWKRAVIANPLHVVGDGQEALEYLSGTGKFAHRTEFPMPGLVLLDLKIPRVLGLDVLKWIREQTALKTLPVIILTSSHDESDVEKAYQLGANSFLVKPHSPDQLADMVKSFRDYWLKHNHPPPFRL
jgi:CheY-like chemotaxis protein